MGKEGLEDTTDLLCQITYPWKGAKHAIGTRAPFRTLPLVGQSMDDLVKNVRIGRYGCLSYVWWEPRTL
jgi:hypothetical protein